MTSPPRLLASDFRLTPGDDSLMVEGVGQRFQNRHGWASKLGLKFAFISLVAPSPLGVETSNIDLRRCDVQMAINTLLNDGVPASEIKGEILLAQVSFDQNGNRQTAYQLLYWPPASNASNATGRAWTLAGAFDAGTNELDITSHLYWMTGQYSATAPAVFTACSPGFYKDQVHPLRGGFAEDVGSIGCASCLPGFYAEQGQESCKKCAQGTYQPSFGSAACLPCELGQVTAEQGSQSLSDCQCARASFMCNHSSVSSAARGCRECPMGLECMAGLDPPLQEPGYWAEAAETCDFQVLRCRSGLQCPGLELGACAAGRMGIACNNCKVNHYPQEDGTCAPCHGEDVWPFILSALAGVALMFLCASSLRADLNQHSLNLLTVAAVGGQMVVALQALRSIRQLGSIRSATTVALRHAPVLLAFFGFAEHRGLRVVVVKALCPRNPGP
eukprot:g11418.t1